MKSDLRVLTSGKYIETLHKLAMNPSTTILQILHGISLQPTNGHLYQHIYHPLPFPPRRCSITAEHVHEPGWIQNAVIRINHKRKLSRYLPDREES